MEKIWNYLLYFIFLFECKATYLSKNILKKLFHGPIIKSFNNFLKKKGSSFEEINKLSTEILNNPKIGKSIDIAGVHMGGLLVLLEFSIFSLIQAILGKQLIQYIWEDNIYKLIFLISSLILPAIINYQLLWKHEKYLFYFEQIENESKSIKIKWARISFGIIVGIFVIFIASFWIMIKTIN